MNARRFWHAVAHRWIAIGLLIVLGPLIGAVVALELPLHYRATAAVLISSNDIGSIDDLAAGSQLAVDAAPSFATLVTSAAVLSPTIAALHLSSSPGQLAHDVRTTVPLQTSTVTISVTSTTRAGAAALANTVADQFAALVPKLSPTLVKSPAFKATKIEPAYAPASDTGLRAGAGVAIGLVAALALGWAVVAAYAMNPVVDKRLIAAQATAVPVIGTLPVTGRKQAREAASRGVAAGVGAAGVGAAVSERDRSVFTTIEAVAPSAHCLMVASWRAGEGRTRTAINLALSAAQSSRSVLLVEADLRNPSIASLLGIGESAGLQGILLGTTSFDDAVRTVGSHGLHVITAGATVASVAPEVIVPGMSAPRRVGNPLLAGTAMSRFLSTAQDRYDLVVIDVPAMSTSADSLGLASSVDGIVVVVDARSTRQRMLTSTVSQLTLAGGSVVGIVLNRVSAPLQLPHLGQDAGLKRLAGV